MTTATTPDPVAPRALPGAIRSEIARARAYLDGLEVRMTEYDDGLWSTAQALTWAGEVAARFNDTTPVRNLDGSIGYGTAGHLDRLVVALVAHVLSIGGTIAHLSFINPTRN